MHVCVSYIHVCMYVHVYTYMHVCMHATHLYMYVCMHVCIHSYVHRQELVSVDNERNGFFIDSILNHEVVKLFTSVSVDACFVRMYICT